MELFFELKVDSQLLKQPKKFPFISSFQSSFDEIMITTSQVTTFWNQHAGLATFYCEEMVYQDLLGEISYEFFLNLPNKPF